MAEFKEILKCVIINVIYNRFEKVMMEKRLVDGAARAAAQAEKNLNGRKG